MKSLGGIGAIILGVVAILVSVGLQTIWAPPAEFNATTQEVQDAPLTVVTEGIDVDPDDPIEYTVAGDGEFTLMYGQLRDIEAWVGDAAHNRIDGVNTDVARGEDPTIEVTYVDGEGEVPNPANSDLWLATQEVTDEVTQRWTSSDAGDWALLIAAVILLQVIFDGNGSYQAPLESRIPPAPEFPATDRVIPERPVVLADTAAGTGRSVAQPAASEPATDEAEQPAAAQAPSVPAVSTEPAAALTTPASSSDGPQLDAAGLPRGWSVRMGAFSVASNADALVRDLQAKELRAYSREITSANNVTMQAVYVGPVLDRAAAQRLLEQMNSEFSNLPGKRIERYEIAAP